jgi:hypothetical protein
MLIYKMDGVKCTLGMEFLAEGQVTSHQITPLEGVMLQVYIVVENVGMLAVTEDCQDM